MNQTHPAEPEGWSRRIRASDRAALAEVFRACYGDLLRYARTFDASLADDLVQEAFMRLWDRRHALDETRSLRAYLFVTVRNLALNAGRRHDTHRRLHETMEKPASATQPDAIADAEMLHARLREWIALLPDRRREAFTLSRYGGLRLDEVAAVMGVSAKTVEHHITQALKDLRRRLHELDAGLLKS